MGIRRHLYHLLEAPTHEARGEFVLNWLISSLVVASVLGTVLESVPDLRAAYGPEFAAIETASLIIFSIEYTARIWIAPEHIPYKHLPAWAARFSYIRSPQGIIDLLAIGPLWFAIFGIVDLRVLIVLRMARILKLIRYSSGISSLLDVLWSERRALGGCLIILACSTVLSASIMHILEGTVQSDKFGTIPDAMWWSLVTLSTIGYGDVVPATGAGKIVAAITIIGGLMMVALPVGIIATAFSDVIHRRDFIVTWSMVARVPAFSHLTARDIADVMQLLRARQFEKSDVIVRRGEHAHAMYFIADGEVEIELRTRGKIYLGAGQFFGEQALLKKTKRSATATAATRAKLLILDAADFAMLSSREPRIAEHIQEIASRRAHDTAPDGTPDAINR
ncbi:MAG: cyclic nucleotide-gated ion channel [Afipia sp.]